MRVSLASAWVGMLLGGCFGDGRVARPPTAVATCELLATKFVAAKYECASITDTTRLLLEGGLEAAVLYRREPDPAVPGTDRLVELASVRFHPTAEAASRASAPAAVAAALMAVVGGAPLYVVNEQARVSVWLRNGAVGDAVFQDVRATVGKMKAN